MTMVSTGEISLGGSATSGGLNRSVNIELGRSATATISLGESAVRTLAGVPSGAISLSNLYGKSNTYAIEFLVVAGGGGSRQASALGRGGGGAGGYIAASTNVSPGTGYSITVGAGGNQANGSNSVAFSNTAIGGGRDGAAGGSGGGGAIGQTGGISPGSGVAGQGFAGGNFSTVYSFASGGGGGANAVGVDGWDRTCGDCIAGPGGSGKTWLNGTTYAGGGGGASWSDFDQLRGLNGGTGGAGGGGQGSREYTLDSYYDPPVNGTANRGGGGGGGGSGGGSIGGSGIVVIRYAGAQRGTGGTVTSAGGYTYHTFNSSGTYTA